MNTAQQICFTVSGLGEFPVDMLRYDECWPADAESASRIAQNHGRREVTLNTYRWNSPTAARWDSFGWLAKNEAELAYESKLS